MCHFSFSDLSLSAEPCDVCTRRFMTTIKKILAQHVAAGDAKPAAITNGNATQSFAPKPRGFTSTEEDNGFDVNQDFSKAWVGHGEPWDDE